MYGKCKYILLTSSSVNSGATTNLAQREGVHQTNLCQFIVAQYHLRFWGMVLSGQMSNPAPGLAAGERGPEAPTVRVDTVPGPVGRPGRPPMTRVTRSRVIQHMVDYGHGIMTVVSIRLLVIS